MKVVIAMDCDGTVDVSAGPIPLDMVRALAQRHTVFCIGSRTLVNFVSLPWDQHPTKSAALARWRLVPADRYIVVDDTPAQYSTGWAGWEFFDPLTFRDKVAPGLLE